MRNLNLFLKLLIVALPLVFAACNGGGGGGPGAGGGSVSAPDVFNPPSSPGGGGNGGGNTPPPTMAISAPPTIYSGNQSSYVVTGTCSEEGQPVSGTLDIKPISGICSSGIFSTSSVDVTFLVDGGYTITLAHTNSLGTSTGDITAAVTKDSAVTLPTLSYQSPSIGYGNGGTVTIRVSGIANGYRVRAYSDASCTSLLKDEVSGNTFHDQTFTTATEGSYYYYFVVDDLVPNSTACFGPKVFVEDTTSPTGVSTISLSSPANGDTSNDATPVFSGTVAASEEGGLVEIFRDGACSAPEKIGDDTVVSSSYSINGNLAVDGSHNGLNQFWSKVTDLVGNVSGCINTGLSYTLTGTGLASLPKIAMVGSASPTQIVILEDNIDVDLNGSQIAFNKLKGDIVNTNVDQGDLLECTGACYAITQGFGTAPWASEAYAGKSFTSYISRYGQFSPKIIVAAVEDDCYVELIQNGAVVANKSMLKNEVHEFTNDLANTKPYKITSTKDVSVYFVSRNSDANPYDRDAYVLTPAANEVIGLSGTITATNSGTTTGTGYRMNGSNYGFAITPTTQKTTAGSSQGTANRAIIVKADKPVSMVQIADGDGVNAAMSLPLNMLATEYGISRGADYITFAAESAGTVTVHLVPAGTAGPFNLTRSSGNANAPFAYRYRPGGTVPAGTRFTCSVPCYAMYDDIGPGADGDETLMMGYSP